jgi:hypothetical protein
MLTNPGVPVHTGRNLLVPEHLKALLRKSVANWTHALAVCTRIGKEDICHAAPRGTCVNISILAEGERKLKIINTLLARAAIPDLGERWPSRLVATAAENRLIHLLASVTWIDTR